MAKKPTTVKLPKTIGACADLIYKLREDKRKAQAVVDAIEANEGVVREHIIQTLPKSETTGVAGKFARVTVVPKVICQVTDWKKLYAHIKKTGSFDFLQRRVSEAAVKERWDQRKKVPGVGSMSVPTLSVTKL